MIAALMADRTRQFVFDLLRRHGGDREKTARFMRDSLRIGGIKSCRELIAEALRDAAPMVVVCAWCKKYLRGDKGAAVVSHGICEPCAKEQEAKL